MIWTGAAVVFFYFLYGTLANEAPINYLFWSIGVAFIARYLADNFKSRKERVDYVGQLMEHGYTRADATSAWEIADIGGSNLLLNLQQAERIAETDLKDDGHDTSNANE